MTFKQAFFKFGVTEDDKVLKGLNEKEEFSTLVNWVINKLPPFKSMDLRHKVNDELYQTSIQKKGKRNKSGQTHVENKLCWSNWL